MGSEGKAADKETGSMMAVGAGAETVSMTGQETQSLETTSAKPQATTDKRLSNVEETLA